MNCQYFGCMNACTKAQLLHCPRMFPQIPFGLIMAFADQAPIMLLVIVDQEIDPDRASSVLRGMCIVDTVGCVASPPRLGDETPSSIFILGFCR